MNIMTNKEEDLPPTLRLLSACDRGDVEAVRTLAQQGVDVNATYGNECALYRAAKHGYVEVLEVLLEYNAKVDSTNDHFKWTVLMVACRVECLAAVQMLLLAGANVNIRDEFGISPLHIAAQYGSTEAVRILLLHKADVSVLDDMGCSVLMIASESNYTEKVRLLLAQHSVEAQTLIERVNTKDFDGWSALMRASHNGCTESVRLLLQYGAKENDAVHGWTALLIASYNNHTRTVQVLLMYGANVNEQVAGWTSLMIACHFGYSKLVEILLQWDANVNLKNWNKLTALMIASQQGHTTIVVQLLNHGAYVNMWGKNGISGLMIACHNGHTQIAEELLRRGAYVNMKDADGRTALMFASAKGYSEIGNILLKYDADVNMQDGRKKSALMFASFSESIEMIKLLLNHGADVNKQIAGWTSLMIACHFGYSKLVEILLQWDANVNLMTGNRLTALMIASQQGHTTIVLQLLDHGAHLNMWEKNGISGLMIACHNGHAQIAEELLRRGAYVNMKDSDGNTALMFASAKGYSEISEILLKYSAKVNMQNKFKQSALMLASFNGSIEMVKLLLNHGADVNTQDIDGLSALVYARIQGHDAVATLLVKCGASLDCQCNVDCQTSLMIAIQRGDVKTVTQLLEFGANVNIQDKDGLTALIIATENRNIEIVELLIKFGATINTQNRRGYTALMVACDKGYLDIVTLLVFHKADIDIQDENGWSALMLACQYGRNEIADCLIRHGANVNLIKNDGWTALILAKMNHHTDTMDLLIKYRATDAVPKKEGFYHMYTSTCTATGTEDSGYGPSACAELLNDKAADVNSTMIMVTNSDELHFTWEGYGLHLYIPEGALPSEVERCTISIKAAVEGNYRFPKNSHLVGAVYWFHCDPKCKFSRSIILEIQHCAKEQNLQTLSFVKAASTEGKPEIKFNKALDCCGTNHGVFPSHSSYGFIFLDEFCGYGVVQEGSEDRQYRADIYYLPQSINQFQIHFTVLWNTEAHHSIIKQHYIQRNAEVGPDMLIEFDSESICLDIPKKGMTTEDDVWKIFPFKFPPEVTKTEVDSFDVGKRIPACQLQAIAQKSHELTHLFHPLKLLGTKTLHDYITLFRSPVNIPDSILSVQPDPLPNDPLTTSVQNSQGAARLPSTIIALQSHEALLPQGHQLQESIAAAFQQPRTVPQAKEHLEPPRLTTLVNELFNRVSAKWEEIGNSLQLESGLLEIIKEDNPKNCRACLREMLKEWLKQIDPPPSWVAIIEAVKDAGYKPLARTLREKYLPNK